MSEIVFLASTDSPTSSNNYFTFASQFFTDRDSTIPVVAPRAGTNELSLESIFVELTERASAGSPQVFDVVNIVSHASSLGGMDMPLRKADEASGRTTMGADLGNAVLAMRAGAAGALKPPGSGAVTAKTRIVLFGCDVGRDTTFLTALGELFGAPASVSAPIRVGVFRLANGKVQHRLARTWSVLWGAKSIDPTKAADWPAARTTFTQKADVKFIKDFATGPLIKTKAQNATLDSTKDEFFFAEYFSIKKSAVAAALPVKTAVITSSDDDDSTEPILITAADVTAATADFSDPTWATVNIAVLASVIDAEVSIADSTQYRTLSFGGQNAPAKGPAPHAAADGSPPPSPGAPPGDAPAFLQSIGDQFLASGGAQSDLDAVIAETVRPDATESVIPNPTPIPSSPDAPQLAATLEEWRA